MLIKTRQNCTMFFIAAKWRRYIHVGTLKFSTFLKGAAALVLLCVKARSAVL
jgi:hypothetical protein